MKFSDLKVYHILLILALVGLIVALIFLIKEDDDSSGSTPDLGANIVAVGSDGSQIVHGTDGNKWQEATGSKFDDSGGAWGIAYGTSSDGSCLWVAVGGGTHNILYSKDGISWEATATGTSKFGDGLDDGRGIAYGTSSDGSCLWVAVGRGTHHILYSKDGTSWQDTATGTSKFDGLDDGRGIAYGTSSDGSCLWVAVGRGTHHILYSKDGTSWQDTATGTSKFGTYANGVAYGTSSDGSCLWVAVGGGDHHILYSKDGTSWQDTATGTSKFGAGVYGIGYGIAYGTSSDGSCLWVAVGHGDHHILYSKDGISWQATATGTSKFGAGGGTGGIAYGTSSDGSCLWVAVGSGGATGPSILYSKDGISWEATATGTSKFSPAHGVGGGIAYGKDSTGSCLWVAIGSGDHPILYSQNGTHWAASTDTDGLTGGYGVAFDHLLYGMSKDYYRPQ